MVRTAPGISSLVTASDQITVYSIPMKQAMDPRFKRSLRLLAAHLSMDSAIVRLETEYTSGPFANIYLLKSKIDSSSIYNMLSADTLKFMYRNGDIGRNKNPFRFPQKGVIREIKGAQ